MLGNISRRANWKNNFNADLSIIGKTFELNDKPHTVVGVLPPLPQYRIETLRAE